MLADPTGGLMRVTRPSPWDNEVDILAVAAESRSGRTGGWWWATDTATLCAVRDTDQTDDAIVDGDPLPAAVVRRLNMPWPDTSYTVWARNLSILGGVGRLLDWGVWDLDRVSDAAYWVAPVEHTTLTVGVVLSPAHCLFLLGESGRTAQIMGMRSSDDWYPTIDLPVEPASGPAS